MIARCHHQSTHPMLSSHVSVHALPICRGHTEWGRQVNGNLPGSFCLTCWLNEWAEIDEPPPLCEPSSLNLYDTQIHTCV